MDTDVRGNVDELSLGPGVMAIGCADAAAWERERRAARPDCAGAVSAMVQSVGGVGWMSSWTLASTEI